MKKSGNKTRLVGTNYVSLEVGDIQAALEFYGDLFSFKLRGRSDSMSFLDMDDPFLALAEGCNVQPGTRCTPSFRSGGRCPQWA